MKIASLVFDPAPRTPTLKGIGIVLAVTPDPAQKTRLSFEIACRLERATVGEDKLALPLGVFLTAVRAPTQRPVTTSVVQDRVLFEDDVTDNGTYVVAVMRGQLDTSDGPLGPFLLHASCYQFISNVIYVG
jgi:hypothetical protein